MIEYAGIYLIKQSNEYVIIITNVSDAVHSIIHCTIYWEVTKTKTYSQHFKHLRWSILQEQRLSAGAQPEICQGRGRGSVVELGIFINISSKTQ